MEAKKAIVDEIAAVASKSDSAIAAEYIGLAVSEMTELRKEARKDGVYIKVVRNTLARFALENSQFECMRTGLVGPLVLFFSSDEPGSAARVVHSFAKNNDKLVVKLVALNGELLDPSDIAKLASMPSLDEARSMLLGLFSAPLSRFVRTVAEPQSGFVRMLAAKQDKIS